MNKFVLFFFVAVLAVANARGFNGRDNLSVKNNEVAPLKAEGRFLLEVPSIGALLYKSLKAVWFLVSTICSIIDYKLAAMALAVNAVIWALSYKFPVILGAALVFGFCKLTGLCGLHSFGLEKVDDELTYASNYLNMGTLKYSNRPLSY